MNPHVERQELNEYWMHMPIIGWVAKSQIRLDTDLYCIYCARHYFDSNLKRAYALPNTHSGFPPSSSSSPRQSIHVSASHNASQGSLTFSLFRVTCDAQIMALAACWVWTIDGPAIDSISTMTVDPRSRLKADFCVVEAIPGFQSVAMEEVTLLV